MLPWRQTLETDGGNGRTRPRQVPQASRSVPAHWNAVLPSRKHQRFLKILQNDKIIDIYKIISLPIRLVVDHKTLNLGAQVRILDRQPNSIDT